jgi:hypothetical protein
MVFFYERIFIIDFWNQNSYWWNSTYIIFIHPDIRKISPEYSSLHGKSFSQNLSHLQPHHYPNSPVPPQWIYLNSEGNINDNNNYNRNNKWQNRDSVQLWKTFGITKKTLHFLF